MKAIGNQTTRATMVAAMNTFLQDFLLVALAGLASLVLYDGFKRGFKRGRTQALCAVLLLVIAFFVSEVVEQRRNNEAQPIAPRAEGKPEQPQVGTPVKQESFLQRYFVRAVGVRPDGQRWAVLITSKEKGSYPELTSTVAAVLEEKGRRNVAIFRPSLVGDGGFGQLYASDPLLIRKLHDYCDGMILGMAEASTHKDNELDGLFTADLSLEIKVVSTESGSITSQFRIHQNGAGFSVSEALASAEKRLVADLQDKLRAALP